MSTSTPTRFSVEAIFKAVDNITGPISKIEARLLGLSKNTRETLGSIDAFNSKIHGGLMAVARGAAVAGAAVGVVGANVIKTGMGFEQAIANVGAVSLMTREQVSDLEKKALELAKTTKFSATEIAGGMELMGKAGFTNAQILAGIAPALSAAAAEGAEFAEVVSIMSNTLNGMGFDKTAKNTQMVADTLTLASARTNSSITSLGESLKNVAPIARQFNIPFKDVVASVALLQDVGIDASEAGTSMATMLTKLATPTDGIKAKMRALGVTFQDANGNMLALPQVLGNFANAAQKSGGNMKQAAFFAELVGLRGQRAALNLQQMFKSGRFAELAKELETAEGKAKKMADLRMNTLTGDLTLLGNAVDDVKIGLFDMNSGPLRGIVQDTTAWIKANKGLILTKVQDFIVKVVKNLPEIWKWTKRIGVGAAAFYTWATAVKTAKLGIESYEMVVKSGALSLKNWRTGMLLGKEALVSTAEAFGVFNRQAAAGVQGLAGLRQGLNASSIGQDLAMLDAKLGEKGILGKLGKLGILGAVAGIGFAFGDWLNTTFKLDEKIASLIAKMTGLEDKLAGRNAKQGLDPNGDQDLGSGNIRDKNGNMIQWGAPNAGITETEHKRSFLAGESAMSSMRMSAAQRRQFRALQDRFHADEDAALRRAFEEDSGIVTPQERTARTISESTTTTTNKAEVVIKDETGRAQVTKPLKGSTRLRIQPSGGL